MKPSEPQNYRSIGRDIGVNREYFYRLMSRLGLSRDGASLPEDLPNDETDENGEEK